MIDACVAGKERIDLMTRSPADSNSCLFLNQLIVHFSCRRGDFNYPRDASLSISKGPARSFLDEKWGRRTRGGVRRSLSPGLLPVLPPMR